MITVPDPAPPRNRTITKIGSVPSWVSTQYPTSTPTSVVTRREMPISEKSAAYAQPRPGSIIRDLAKPREYTSRPRRSRRRPARSAKDDEAVDVNAPVAGDDDSDRVVAVAAEVRRPENLAVQRRRAVEA